MNKPYRFIFTTLLVAFLATGPALATSVQDSEQAEAHYTAMLKEAELARMEAESARQEATRVAQIARDAARQESELARQEAEMARAANQDEREELEERTRERAARLEEVAMKREFRQQEMARAREELGRAHRELREASREIAQAHRELARTEFVHKTVHVVNLGDRAVIGVIMGKEVENGVEIIGISPGGPAERAGLLQGDILVSIDGEDLGGDGAARELVYRVMADASDGEELAVTVDRDGERWEYTISPERREPSSWQSMIHLSGIEPIDLIDGEPLIMVERIEIPEIDTEKLEAQLAETTERLKAMNYSFSVDDDDFHVTVEEYSDLAGSAFQTADLWFGLPHSQGLELASVNQDLGAYFKTDRGVLVIKAREGNAYELTSGDVILEIDSTPVNSPADVMRALRETEPGDDIDLRIKRNRRDKTLSVVMPENRLGYLLNSHPH